MESITINKTDTDAEIAQKLCALFDGGRLASIQNTVTESIEYGKGRDAARIGDWTPAQVSAQSDSFCLGYYENM